MAVQPIAAHKSGRRIYLMSSATQVDVRRSGLFCALNSLSSEIRRTRWAALGRLQRSPDLSAKLMKEKERGERMEGKGDHTRTKTPGYTALTVFTYMTSFWATVCKTVRPMLSDRCMSVCAVCPVLSVTLVYCDQTVEWIIVKLGMQVYSALATLC